MTCFFRDYNTRPEKELHRILQMVVEDFMTSCTRRAWWLYADTSPSDGLSRSAELAPLKFEKSEFVF